MFYDPPGEKNLPSRLRTANPRNFFPGLSISVCWEFWGSNIIHQREPNDLESNGLRFFVNGLIDILQACNATPAMKDTCELDLATVVAVLEECEQSTLTTSTADP
jgi:hypothetical protein